MVETRGDVPDGAEDFVAPDVDVEAPTIVDGEVIEGIDTEAPTVEVVTVDEGMDEDNEEAADAAREEEVAAARREALREAGIVDMNAGELAKDMGGSAKRATEAFGSGVIRGAEALGDQIILRGKDSPGFLGKVIKGALLKAVDVPLDFFSWMKNWGYKNLFPWTKKKKKEDGEDGDKKKGAK